MTTTVRLGLVLTPTGDVGNWAEDHRNNLTRIDAEAARISLKVDARLKDSGSINLGGIERTTWPAAGGTASALNDVVQNGASANLPVAASGLGIKKSNGITDLFFVDKDLGLMSCYVIPESRPTLLLDFANGRSIPPSVNFSRSTIATYIGANGFRKTASANEPRFEFNSEGVCLGLLREDARTNSCLWSNDLTNAAWIKNNCTATENSALGMDSTMSACTVSRTATGNQFVQQIISTTTHANKTWTISVDLALGTLTGAIVLRLRDGAGVEIATNTVTVTTTMQRYSVTGTFGATPAANIRILIDPTNDAGAAGDSFYIGEIQLEEGNHASSPIHTSAVAATRTADSLSITGSNFSNFYNPYEGTLLRKVMPALGALLKSPQEDCASCIVDSTGANAIILRFVSGTSLSTHQADSVIYVSSVSQFNTVGKVGLADNTFYTQAVAYKKNNFASSVNGAAVETSAAGSIPGVNHFELAVSGNLYIAQILYYPKRLSNEVLVGMTQ